MDSSDLDLDEGLPVGAKRGPGGIIAIVVLLAAAGAAWWYFSNPSPDDLVTSANVNLVQGQPDVAIGKYQQALEVVPQHLGAHRGMAKALQQKGDLAKAGEWLDKAYALPGAGEDLKDAIRKDLADHYLKAAKDLARGDPEAYEAALVRTIGYDDRSEANGLLATHLTAMAELESSHGAHGKAADRVARIVDLEVPTRAKDAAWKAEAEYRIEAFSAEFAREFAAKHKDGLIKRKAYDAEAERFGVTAEAEAPPRTGEPQNLHEVRIKNLANKLAKEALLKFLGELAGASPDKLAKLPELLVAWPQQTWTEGWVRRPSRYMLGVSVAYEDAVRLIYYMRHGDKLKAWGRTKLKRK